jgi:hypothetical protein
MILYLKTTFVYYLTPVSIPIIKETKWMLASMQGKGDHSWW